MATYKNTSGAAFTLPDGRNVPNGATVEMDKETLAIPGVFQFIDAGKMEPVAPEKTAPAPKRGRPAKGK